MKLSEIKPNPDNPRIIKEDKFKKLVQSIKDFPDMLEKRPIVIDEDNIVLGGNMRLRALQELKYKDVPVIVAKGWTEEQKKEFIVKDNVGFGEWDWDILANEWSDNPLTEWGLDVWEPEFEPVDGLTDADDVPAVPEEPKTKLGDLYILGDHRLLCGDSTKAEEVEKLMNGEKADICFTSPPYNSGDVAMRGGGNFAFGKKGSKTLYQHSSDDKSKEEYFAFCMSVLHTTASVMSANHSVLWNVSYNANSRADYGDIVFSKKHPFQVKETIIWDKGHAIPITSEGIFSRNSELIFLLSLNEKYLTQQKIGKNSVYWNTWRISSNGSQLNEHKACFPVELPTKALKDFGGDVAYDPFLGSGTTLIASEKLGRKCYGMELDPKYCDVIVKRWEDFTGKKATKE